MPYHQTLYDLLDLRPAESAAARGMIEAHESRTGRRLPAAVREWYLVDGPVPLRDDMYTHGNVWFDTSIEDRPMPLGEVIEQLEGSPLPGMPAGGPPGAVAVVQENVGVWRAYILTGDCADPPVVVDYDPDVVGWTRVADHFSTFLLDWFALNYSQPGSLISAPLGANKPYLHGRWAFAREAPPALPPHIDYLIDHLGDPTIQASAGGVRWYDFMFPGGGLRVTTDDVDTNGGVSSWWLHAETEEALARLADLAAWGGVGPWLRRYPPMSGPIVEIVGGEGWGFRPAWRRWVEGGWARIDADELPR